MSAHLLAPDPAVLKHLEANWWERTRYEVTAMPTDTHYLLGGGSVGFNRPFLEFVDLPYDEHAPDDFLDPCCSFCHAAMKIWNDSGLHLDYSQPLPTEGLLQ